MNCEICQLELEDLISGELPSRRAQELRSHLADCSECREHRLALERELEMFSLYYDQTASEPRPEMWASIRERLREESGSREFQKVVELKAGRDVGLLAWLRRPVFLRQLSAALALVVLTVLVTMFFVSRRDGDGGQIVSTVGPSPKASSPSPNGNSNGGPAVSPTVGSTPGVVTATDDRPPAPVVARKETTVAPPRTRTLTDQEMIQEQLKRTEREYVAAIKMLDQAIVKRKGSIDSEAYKQYEASLALIDDSIDKSRAALRTRAGDPVVGQFLIAAYARKVELMQEIALQ